jgi:signal transduction histidine kinase
MQMARFAGRESRAVATQPRTEAAPGWEPASLCWENSADCQFIVRVEAHDTFVYEGVNPAVERQTGLLNAVLAGRRVEEVIAPEPAMSILGRFRQCIQHDAPITYGETLAFPLGRKRWRTTLVPVHDNFGRIVRIVGSARAAPARQIALGPDSTILEFERILDLAPDSSALLDSRLSIVFVNKMWSENSYRFGLPASPVGLNYMALLGGAAAAAVGVDDIRRWWRSGGAEQFECLSQTCRFGRRHFVRRLTPATIEGAPFVVAAYRDVSDLVAARRELAAATERLLAVQEEERTRIGLELHDSTSQHLTVIGLGLSALRRAPASAELLDDMGHALDEANREIRTLTYLLHPPELDELGPEVALRRFVDGFSRRSRLGVVMELQGDLSAAPPPIAKAVYRIVQEALTNVHRHSHAARVVVRLRLSGRGLRLTIADNGGGGEVTARIPATGVGIRGMEARVKQFGGRLSVARRSFGTIVRGFIPGGALRVAYGEEVAG